MRRPPGQRGSRAGPGQERLAEDDAGDARIAQAADGRRGRWRRRRRGCRRRGAGRGRRAARGSAAVRAVGEDEAGGRPRPTSSSTSASSVGGVGRRQGNAASRSGRGSSPTASQSPATARHVARASSGSSAIASDSTTRVAPAANASRIASASSRPPASWSGTATRDGDRADRLEIRRAAALRAVEVDEVDDAGRPARRTAPRCAPGRSVGAPTPVDAPGQKTTRERPPVDVDRGDDLHRVSGPLGRPVADVEAAGARVAATAARSSRRWKLIGQRAVAAAARRGSRLSENAAPRRRCSSARSPSSRTLPEQVATAGRSGV